MNKNVKKKECKIEVALSVVSSVFLISLIDPKCLIYTQLDAIINYIILEDKEGGILRVRYSKHYHKQYHKHYHKQYHNYILIS